MGFGKILNEWENNQSNKINNDNFAKKNVKEKALENTTIKAHPVDIWLNKYGVFDKDAVLDLENNKESPANKRRRLQSMKPEASIDLHGLTQEQALTKLDAFFLDSIGKGLEKIQIIHGKGLHSESSPVLKTMVRDYIEKNPKAGEFGSSAKADGGSGATWVILK